MLLTTDKILNLAIQFEKNATSKILKKADAKDFYVVLNNYEKNSEAIKDFVEALRSIAENFKNGSDMNDPAQKRIAELLFKQSESVANCIGDVEFMDSEIDELQNLPNEE